MTELLPLEDAIQVVLARAKPLESEVAPLVEARGRVLAEPARAATDLPPFASSAMDGFAVRDRGCPRHVGCRGASRRRAAREPVARDW